MKCRKCGVEIIKGSNAQKYCSDCAYLNILESKARYRRKISNYRKAIRNDYPEMHLREFDTELGTLRENDLEVIEVNGKQRIKAAVKLEEKIKEMKKNVKLSNKRKKLLY